MSNTSAWVESGPVTVSAVTKYYYHGDQRVAMRQEDVVYFIHGDHLGSTSLTINAGGDRVAEARYLPYGEVRWAPQGAGVTDYTFTGQRRESFNLMDYRARHYDARLGRFISADTIAPDYTNPQALNRYSYVLGNPLRHTDPSGHCVPGVNCPGDKNDEVRGDVQSFSSGTSYAIDPNYSLWNSVGPCSQCHSAKDIGHVPTNPEMAAWIQNKQQNAQQGAQVMLYAAMAAPEVSLLWNSLRVAYAYYNFGPQPSSATVGGGRAVNQIGDWGVRYAEENMGVTAEQWSTTPGRRWDGYTGQVDRRPVEIKTTITNKSFSLTPHIRKQIAADQGTNTRWIFVGGSGVSRGLNQEVQIAGLEWVAQPYLPGANWQAYFDLLRR